MPTSWVTGAAGFIGSRLCAQLADRGDIVVPLDSFTSYYSTEIKRINAQGVEQKCATQVRQVDLTRADLSSIPEPNTIFHVAGQPGVRPSWGNSFRDYVSCNILATQRVVEHASAIGANVVYASSSSVYGIIGADSAAVEGAALTPHSPYGISKLTGELLVRSYSANLGLRSCSMRYFTVYGPGQRPDMAIHRLIECGITGAQFQLFGDGTAIREFTYVDDVVRATADASDACSDAGQVFNVAGGSLVSMNDLIDTVESALGASISVNRVEAAKGDVPVTRADTSAIGRELGWAPRTSLEKGVRAQVEWHLEHREILEGAMNRVA